MSVSKTFLIIAPTIAILLSIAIITMLYTALHFKIEPPPKYAEVNMIKRTLGLSFASSNN